MNKEGLVSVIIPAYNCEKYLSEAVDSVLAQTYKEMEIIIVDDGSTDGTEAIAKSFELKIKYIVISHTGPGAARNAGVLASSGEFLAFLDADDVWTKEKLSLQVELLKSHPDIDMVFGNIIQFREDSGNGKGRADTETEESVPGYLPGTMLVRKNSFMRCGLFPVNRKVGEFIEWYMSAQEKSLKGRMLPDLVMKRRIHGKNLGLRERNDLSDYAKIMKTMLDRKKRRQ